MRKMFDATPDVPPEVEFAAQSGKLVVFVGAGISRLINCPSWQGFADKVLEQLTPIAIDNRAFWGRVEENVLDCRLASKTGVTVGDIWNKYVTDFDREIARTKEHIFEFLVFYLIRLSNFLYMSKAQTHVLIG
jgi:hypothetical protein